MMSVSTIVNLSGLFYMDLSSDFALTFSQRWWIQDATIGNLEILCKFVISIDSSCDENQCGFRPAGFEDIDSL